ncbi:MAG: Gfo/Idh/MocA family oxidoreductase [Clostridia bacterium]|nr:Gfo/Idh/MocA family oxidoreductase [Clostridia bacterium]
MFKTVILGCENSHANSFLESIKNDPEFSSIEVIGVYSDEADKAKALSDEYGVKIMQSFDEAKGKVDGVIITARHGDNHMKYAAPYIEDGVPFFIDKPFTINPDEGEKLCKRLEENGCRFVGGSSLKHVKEVKEMKKDRLDGKGKRTVGGFLCAPIDLGSPYGGFYFYAQHLVEILIEVFGVDVKKVCALKSPVGITLNFRYDDFDVTGIFAEKNYIYGAVRHTEEGVLGGEFPLGNECFKLELMDFLKLLTKESDGEKADRMMKPVYIMNAIMDSVNNDGKETQVK